MTPRRTLIALLTLVAIAPGCRLFDEPEEFRGHSPLSKPGIPSDGAVLEVYFARFPYGQSDLNEPLWRQLDELVADRQLRRRQAAQGLRVGRVGGHMPAELERLLQLTSTPAAEGQAQQVDLQAEPTVTKRKLVVRGGSRSEVQASGVYESMPVFTKEDGALRGRTYEQAQGVFAITAFAQPDGRVTLELVPEVHYGQARNNFVGGEGIWRLQAGRPRQAFDELRERLTLSPGEMVVLGCLPDRLGSLGDYFFTDRTGGKREQKLLLIRLVQTPRDDTFDPDAIGVQPGGE